MSEQPTLEIAVAVRMGAATRSTTAGASSCPLVATLDSADALKLAAEPAMLSERLGHGGIVVVEAADDLAAVTARVAEFDADSVLSAVVAPGQALFVVAATPADLIAAVAAVEQGDTATGDAADGTMADRLGGTIALVTGAAQGFGKGIAFELAAKGACIVVADLNDELGEACVNDLTVQYGTGCAIYCHMDVTNLESVEAGVAAAVKQFGGIDMLVANAGVVKAGGLAEMDEKSFDFVTRVNYNGYFIGAKAVAPWMKLQSSLNRAHFMDIIQINSKSGLEGSKNNFAYAGSKFGAIGLTQSFALELVGDNIKVNSICPGNYFDGPLWSDPERGLFLQYLNSGKVPGAKTVEDVRAFYMAKVPMNRGCTPEDVAIAIAYLVEQKYETGQAIPVTGGQVMLN